MTKSLSLLLCAAFAHCAEASANEDAVGITLLYSDIAGTGANAPNQFSREIDDISDGREIGVNVDWEFAANWRLLSELRRSELQYESPLTRDCPLVAGILLGYEFCQAALTPRFGELEDRLEMAGIAIERNFEVTDRFEVRAAAGYQWKRWSSRGDVEADTLSNCRLESLPGDVPDCEPVSSSNHTNGWLAELEAQWNIAENWTGTIGWRWEQERYRIYRNVAAVEFCDQNVPSEFGGFCDALDGFLPDSAFSSDSWDWWYSSLAWRPGASNWEISLRYEDGGRRDWRVLTSGIGFRW